MSLFNKILNTKINMNDKEEVSDIQTVTNTIKVHDGNLYNIPAIRAYVELMQNLVGSMSVYLYEESENKTNKVFDYRTNYLNKQASILYNGVDLKRMWIKDLIIEGVCYGYLIKEGNSIKGIEYVEPSKVQFKKLYNSNNDLVDIETKIYTEKGVRHVEFSDMIICLRNSKDGLSGERLIDECRHLLDLSIKEVVSYENHLDKHSRLSGIISFPTPFKREVYEKLKSDINKMFTGSMRDSNLMIVNGQQPTYINTNNLNPSNSKLIESREFNNDLLYKMFNISDVKDINHIYKTSLNGYITIIEDALNRAMLLEDEKFNKYFMFDSSELLRSDYRTLVDTTKTLLESGIMSLSESRDILNLHSIENDYFVNSLGHIYKDVKTGEVYIPNMDVKTRIDGEIV